MVNIRNSNVVGEQYCLRPSSTMNNSTRSSSKFMQKLRAAFNKRELCPYDLRVSVSEGKSYSMHRDLFIMASPVFESLLRNATELNGTPEGIAAAVKLQIESRVFILIRSFLYTGELPQNLEIEDALGLLESSMQYRVDALSSHLVSFVQQKMTPKNSLKVLQTARDLELKELEEAAIKLMCLNANKLLSTPEFKNLGSYDVCRLLSNDALCCDELNVFNAALRWAENKAKHSENSKQALKYYFSQVAMCIRFPLMSPMELALVTLTEGILEQDDIVKLFQFVCLPDYMKNSISLNYSCVNRSNSLHKMTASQRTSQETQTSEIPAAKTNNMPPPTITPRKRTISCSSVAGTSTIKSSPSPNKRVCLQLREEDQNESDDLFTSIIIKKQEDKIIPSFEELTRRYIKEENTEEIEGFYFTGITLENNYRTMLFKNCKDLKLEAVCKFIDKSSSSSNSAFLDFISHFDPMRYILFNTKGTTRMTAENIWSLNENILLKFNGVTFLKVKHAKEMDSKKEDVLVLNYISDSKKILSNPKLRPTVLAISNCEFSLKPLKDRCKQLEKLILYRVWGEYTLEEIMRECPSLTELVCWKYVHTNWVKGSNFCAPLCLNFSNLFSAKYSIQKVVLFQAELKFPTRCSGIATSVTKLILDSCHSITTDRNAHISEVFHNIFPSLETLAVLEKDSDKIEKHGNLATSSLINCVVKQIKTIKSIQIEGMKWNGAASDDAELSIFLEEATNINGKPKNYKLIKEFDEKWIGTDMDETSKESIAVDGGYWTNKDKLEYQYNSLYHFYDSSETFEDYFEQHNFPKPTLWV